jgi:hypothetical protein
MSGRLVILRHKSWNVWNQDNQEKVLRDERLHKEKLQTQELNQKNLLREQQREKLLETSNNINANYPTKSVNFFEEKNQRVPIKENAEYRKEKNDKEQRKRKQEGIAAWSLSDGTDITPWYSKSSKPHTNQSYTIEPKRKKDELMKHELDPMNKFIKSAPLNSFPEESGSKCKQRIASVTKTSTQILPTEKLSSIVDISEAYISREDNLDLFTKLRHKRLERERKECKKAASLLANIDIYGDKSHTSNL